MHPLKLREQLRNDSLDYWCSDMRQLHLQNTYCVLDNRRRIATDADNMHECMDSDEGIGVREVVLVSLFVVVLQTVDVVVVVGVVSVCFEALPGMNAEHVFLNYQFPISEHVPIFVGLRRKPQFEYLIRGVEVWWGSSRANCPRCLQVFGFQERQTQTK